MLQLTKYAYCNARIRAFMSRLLEAQVLRRLADTQRVEEFLDILKMTPYESFVSSLSEGADDVRVFERELTRYDLALFRRVLASFFSSTEKKTVLLVMERYELNEMKVALRIWHRRAVVNSKDFFLGERICRAIDFSQIASAKSFDDILSLTRKTPYGKPLAGQKEAFLKKGSLFLLETALDIDYFQRLSTHVESLGTLDRSIARKIVGLEIDAENISWLLRTKRYYPDAAETGWFIPGGSRIRAREADSFFTPGETPGIAESVSLGPFSGIREIVNRDMTSIERFLRQVLMSEVRKALRGYPFTVGVILGYLTMKQQETRLLMSLYHGKRLGMTTDS